MRKKMTLKEIERLCFECDVPCDIVTTRFMGVDVEAYKCSKCKEITFNDKQAKKALLKVQEKHMKNSYKKNPIRIGHSWGFTFPKEIVKLFKLDSRKTKLSIHPKLSEKKIEIKVG